MKTGILEMSYLVEGNILWSLEDRDNTTDSNYYYKALQYSTYET